MQNQSLLFLMSQKCPLNELRWKLHINQNLHFVQLVMYKF